MIGGTQDVVHPVRDAEEKDSGKEFDTCTQEFGSGTDNDVDGGNTCQVALQENGACGQNSIPYSIKICGSLILWIFNCSQATCHTID